MQNLTNKDKEIYLGIFHDSLIWEIGRLEDETNDPNMWEYQISILEQEDPIKFAKKIKELKQEREKFINMWQKNRRKIKILEDELGIYKKSLEEIRKSENMEGVKCVE
jgi:hypothetical protein